MEKLLEAIQNRDLIEAKRAFGTAMAEKTKALIEQRRIDLARSIMIEAEEKKGDDDMDDDGDGADGDDGKDAKKDKDEDGKGDEEDK